MTPQQLVRIHGDNVQDDIASMTLPQREQIGHVSIEHGMGAVMDAINISVGALSHCMRDAGYMVCEGECEEWFPVLELDENRCCEDCALSEEFMARDTAGLEEQTPEETGEAEEP